MKAVVPLTVRTTRDQVEQLDAIAAQLDRPRNYLLKEAISQYLAYHQVLIDKVKTGIEQADADDLVPHDQVFARLKDKRRKRRS